MRSAIAIALAVPALIAAAPVRAQQAALDPATITVPDLRFTPTASDRDNFHKYFFFWQRGVDFEQARADLEECYAYLAVPPVSFMPYFMTLDEAPLKGKPQPDPMAAMAANYGLVGVAIGALVAGPLNLRARQQKLRMCMGFKNYTRYGASKLLWERITDGDAPHAIQVQAKIASGPKPEGEAVDP